MNGPFLMDRGIANPLRSSHLLLLSAPDDHVVRPFVVACLVSLRGHAPGGHRVPSTRTAALATTMRMVDGIHGNTPDSGSNTAPAFRTRFPQLAQIVLVIANLANRRTAIDMDSSHLAGSEPQRRILAFPGNDLNGASSAASNLPTFPRFHLDTVHQCSHRNALQRQGVAGPDRRITPGLYRITGFTTPRRQDVPPFTVRVEDQRKVSASVRVILDSLHSASDAVLVSLEVDDPIMPLVTAATMPGRDTSLVVAPARSGFWLQQRRMRLALVQIVANRSDDKPPTC